jgi:hypothetical protein
MALSPEQLLKLQEIAARVANEHDRDNFNVLCMELITLYEEADRLKHEVAQDVA